MGRKGGTPEGSRWRRIASLVLPRLAFYPFVVASLLVFPAWLPYMILCWLLLFELHRKRGTRVWRSLGVCLAILVLKRVDWTPGLLVLALMMAVCIALDHWKLKKPLLFTSLLLVPVWFVMTLAWSLQTHASRKPALAPDRAVVCLGDSLSSGGYARVLGSMLSVPVVDKAQGGITTVEGLRLIPEILALKPQAVVIELGGHDYLRGRSRRETRANLETMIRAIRNAGAEVLLCEVPRGFVSDPFWGVERKLAREHDLELVHDGAIRQLVLFSPFTPLGTWTGRQLSYDGLHPNDAGNVHLAGRVAASLRNVFGEGILAQAPP